MMKTNVQVKDEPVDFQIDKLLQLYTYQSTNKSSRTKSSGNDVAEASTCAWCQKLGGRSFTLHTENGDSKTLCSEVCFNQYRRASFKKNKGSDGEMDQNGLTMKIKSSEKRKREQTSNDCNRRKIFLPHRHLTPSSTKTKTNEPSRSCSPASSSKPSRSSSPSLTNGQLLHVSSPSNLPLNLTWLPSTLPWPNPLDLNRFSYPFLPPLPPPPLPPPPPPAPSVLPVTSSNLFTTLSKSTSSNFTCILPTFIPLPIPIPIPLCLPIHLPCTKCSIEVKDQSSQTIFTSPKRTRRLSI